ncbi:MAG: glycerol-3-phosphate acyltransferase [Oscillospiraceae bacterium]|nr:glycerol-3-phosphate acyltransferase [Oscillospiraceae bacterium]
MILYWILLLITALVAYVFGSLDTRVIASNFIFRRGLRRLGKGGAWFSNFYRIYGIMGFVKIGLLEIAKNLLPIIIGSLLLSIKGHPLPGRAFAGFCLVMGTLFSMFYNMRGSHGAIAMVIAAISVDTSVGIAVGAIAAAVTWFTKYVSLGTIVGAFAFILASLLVLDDRLVILLCVFTALLVLVKHVPAASRLLKGTEQKFKVEEDISYKLDEEI